MKKTKPKRAAARSEDLIPAGVPLVWNTLGVATALGVDNNRILRAHVNGELAASVRIVGGDGKPRIAFTLADVQGFADTLIARESREGGDKKVLAAARKFLGSL